MSVRHHRVGETEAGRCNPVHLSEGKKGSKLTGTITYPNWSTQQHVYITLACALAYVQTVTEQCIGHEKMESKSVSKHAMLLPEVNSDFIASPFRSASRWIVVFQCVLKFDVTLTERLKQNTQMSKLNSTCFLKCS